MEPKLRLYPIFIINIMTGLYHKYNDWSKNRSLNCNSYIRSIVSTRVSTIRPIFIPIRNKITCTYMIRLSDKYHDIFCQLNIYKYSCTSKPASKRFDVIIRITCITYVDIKIENI